MLKWSVGTLVGVLVLAGLYFYNDSQKSARTREACRPRCAFKRRKIGEGSSEFVLSYTTAAEKQKAATKAFQDVVNRYGGETEGQIAHYYLGIGAADRGDNAEAEKELKAAAAGGNNDYASQAELSLARAVRFDGRNREAETLLKELMAKPTTLVSKDQATISLARVLASTNRPRKHANCSSRCVPPSARP